MCSTRETSQSSSRANARTRISLAIAEQRLGVINLRQLGFGAEGRQHLHLNRPFFKPIPAAIRTPDAVVHTVNGPSRQTNTVGIASDIHLLIPAAGHARARQQNRECFARG